MTYITTIFKISGMHCTSCAFNIDGELEDTGKIKKANTSYAKQQTAVEFDPNKITHQEIITIIKNVGYDAIPQGESNAKRTKQ